VEELFKAVLYCAENIYKYKMRKVGPKYIIIYFSTLVLLRPDCHDKIYTEVVQAPKMGMVR
jgi:hypothetical protein